MKPKQIMRIIVDAAMTVLLLLLMTYERIVVYLSGLQSELSK